MATVVQQTPVYYVASASQGQSQVLIQMQPTSQPRFQSGSLYLRKHHKVLGILQMSVGCLCFIMETIGTCIGPYWGSTFTGFYTGIIFFVAGLLGFLAYQKNNHCFIIACMVMSIIASLTVVSGIMTSIMEMKVFVPSHVYEKFRHLQIVKESIIIGACAFELFLSIVHASFTCATCCQCCWPDSRRPVTSRALPATLIIQQPSDTAMLSQTTMGGAVGGSIIAEASPLPMKSLITNESGGAGSNSYDPPPYSQI